MPTQKGWISINALFSPGDIAKLDRLAQCTCRNRSQILRMLVREVKVREPDLVVELMPDMVTAEPAHVDA